MNDDMHERTSDETVRIYLKETLEHLIAAGRSAHDLVGFSIDKFGKKIIPYLNDLQEDVRDGRVKIHNLAEEAKTAVFGIHVSPEQREQMIRSAAYMRAEQRDFSGGNVEEDWRLAEQEIDELLAKQKGLLEKSRKSIASVAGIAEFELAEVKGAVRHWLDSRAKSAKSGHRV